MAKYQLTNKTKYIYGAGAAPFGIKENGFAYFLLIFYSQVLGLEPVLASLALTIAIAFDAVSDPLICLLYTSPSPRDLSTARMPSSA